MADNNPYNNQRKRKHSDIIPNAANRVRQRHNDESLVDGGSSPNTMPRMVNPRQLVHSEFHLSLRWIWLTEPIPQLRLKATRRATLQRRISGPTTSKSRYSRMPITLASTRRHSTQPPIIRPTSPTLSRRPSIRTQFSAVAIAIEATNTSKTAEYAPKCHPKTRTKIIADIVDMVETGKKPIIWFSGPAGREDLYHEGGGRSLPEQRLADMHLLLLYPRCGTYHNKSLRRHCRTSALGGNSITLFLDPGYHIEISHHLPTLLEHSDREAAH